MTPTQENILDYLTARSPEWIGVHELCDVSGSKTEDCVHVQIHRIRHVHGQEIESRLGAHGGYRIAVAA